MEQERFQLNRPAMLSVPLRDAELLMDAGDGDGALLYLYLLKNGGTLDIDRAAQALRLSPRAIRLTAQRLERLGIFSAAGERALPGPSGELPEYQAADVVRRSQSDAAFRALAEETQTVLGRVLSSADLKALFGIYDELALPPEVIMLLIHRCKEENDQRYGAERSLGFAAIKKKALEWFDQELMTYEQAEAYLAEQDRKRSLAGQIQRAIGIRGRELSPTERRYVMSWIDLGFGPEALALAADRTVTNTGALKWRYMDSIVQSWHGKGLHTVEQIEQGDRRRDRSGEGAAQTHTDARELERLRRLREKMRNG